MYTGYYNLTSKPFENTPDPLFLYLSRQHREVLSALLYGIDSAKGFTLVSGEVGTGKTTLIRSLLEKIDPDHIVISIINPRSTFDDVFKLLAKKLKVPINEENRLETIEKLRFKLETLNQEGHRAVILIDEAHLLSEESLQEIRLLSNIENEKFKLIQIILVGQNEIYSLLDKDSQKSLKQRIVINRQLHPLNKEETTEYIKHRLFIAGRKDKLFNDRAVTLVLRESGGIPRLINQICDNALLIGYALKTPLIDRKIIKEVINDMAPASPKKLPYPFYFLKTRKTWAIAGAIALLIVIIEVNNFSFRETIQLLMSRVNRYTDSQSLSPAFTDKSASEAVITNSRKITFEQKNRHLVNHQAPLSYSIKKQSPDNHLNKPIPVAAKLFVPSLPDKIKNNNSHGHSIGENIQKPRSNKVIQISPHRVKMPNRNLASLSKTIDTRNSSLPSQSKTVQPNDWLASIALKAYGSSSETLIDLIQMANEDIKNINRIYSGQKIELPQITRDSMIVQGGGINFHIHYASFYNFKPAQRVIHKLIANGKKAFVVPSLQGDNMVFRVYVGILSDRNKAEKLLKSIEFKYLPFL